MRASAGILFFIWGCEGGKTVTEPVMTELTGLDTPTSVAVATAVGTGTVRYFEIWLVDRSGLFQLDTLTEGQR